jgi:hypothetical protein
MDSKNFLRHFYQILLATRFDPGSLSVEEHASRVRGEDCYFGRWGVAKEQVGRKMPVHTVAAKVVQFGMSYVARETNTPWMSETSCSRA